VDALVIVQREPFHHETRQQTWSLLSHEREDAAVVVGIGVDIQEMAGQAFRKPRQKGDVAALADIHHALKHGSCLPIRTDLLLPSGT